MLVRDAGPEDLPWIRALLDERWGGQEQVVDGESYRPAELPGFIATIDDERVGYAALRVVGDIAEIGVIDGIRPREGIGTALVDALEGAARSRGCARCRAVTTNENRVAQAFYASLGFELVGVREGAVTRSRRIKPAIPLEGDDGTPITDELVYERSLRRSRRG
ncbi:MAG TPA: GNAT family N-acetyltransferase [Actinomycetota bacterium]|nr:GNAT family N-acetyltransferase [Actinomycetota bacterium]